MWFGLIYQILMGLPSWCPLIVLASYVLCYFFFFSFFSLVLVATNMLCNPVSSMERCLAEAQFLQLAMHTLLLLNGELDSVKCRMKSGISFWIWNCFNYDVFFPYSTNKTLERYQRCCYNPQDANISDRETQVYFFIFGLFLFLYYMFHQFFYA